MIASLSDRFWSKVDASGDGCWEWLAFRDRKGYGRIGASGQRRVLGAHRVSWELHHGPIPDDLTIDHLCCNTSCVRPDHLQLLTAGQNSARMWQVNPPPRPRAADDEPCPKGHTGNFSRTVGNEGKRKCNTCNAERARAWRRNQKAGG